MNRLSVIQDEGDRYTRSISAEKVTYEQLGAQIKLLNSKLDAQRRNMGGVHAAKETQQMISKQIRILENRLDKALVKFNEALATNKKLRLNIDSLRRERVVFDNIYRKLEVELKVGIRVERPCSSRLPAFRLHLTETPHARKRRSKWQI